MYVVILIQKIIKLFTKLTKITADTNITYLEITDLMNITLRPKILVCADLLHL